MRWLGIAQRAFDLMCIYANQRQITPQGETLTEGQIIQIWVAELEAEIRGARLRNLACGVAD